MKTNYLKSTLFLFFAINVAFSQVGIGNSDPKSTLDITAINATGTSTSVDGLNVPRVDRQRAQSMTLANIPVSTIIYVNSVSTGSSAVGTTTVNVTATGFYYFNGSVWVRLDENAKVKTGAVASTGTLVEPNVTIPVPVYTGSNTTTQSFDLTTITKTIAISGAIGTLTNVTCNVQFSHNWMADADLYLQSPIGQIIELSTDNGGTWTTGATFNVTFSDAGAANINPYAGSIAGTYRPEGTTNADIITPTITTMAGFTGNPNGTWTLHLRDDATGDNFNFTSFSLILTTNNTVSYRLVGETSIAYKSGCNVVTNAMYSANSTDDQGFITALSRSTATAGAVGTTSATVPGTVLSYASDSPKQGSGNYWATTYNQNVSNGLVDGTTYYFQLWAKVNVESPAASNELFSLIPMMLPQ